MIKIAKQLQRAISGDAEARGQSRSPRMELYTRSNFSGPKKNPQSFCRLRRQTALWV